MKAAVIAGKARLAIEDIEKPVPGPGELTLKVRYCGICGSDVRMFADGAFVPGFVMGHEFSGTVDRIGPGTEGFAPGDRVTVNPMLACGACPACLGGDRPHCSAVRFLGSFGDLPGAFAEYVRVKASMVRHLPAEVTDEEGAAVEPCAVSLRAVRRSGMVVGDTVAIFGAGPIGLFVIQLARLGGARWVLAVEPAPQRAAAATLLGADRVFDPSREDPIGAILSSSTSGVDIAFVCGGAPALVEQAVGSVRVNGRVVIVGGGMAAQIVPEHWMWKEVEVIGSFAYRDEFDRVIELLRQRRVSVREIISGVIPLERLEETLRTLARPTSEIKVLVRPGAE